MAENEVSRFSMEPIDRMFMTQGDAAEFFEIDVRRYRTWLENGVGWELADRLACQMGVHPSSVWGDQWWLAAHDDYGTTLFDEEEDEDARPKPKGPPPGFWEDRYRKAKVDKLVAHLESTGVTAETAETYSTTQRREVASAAGCNKPSDKSWAMVIERLKASVAVAS